MKEIFTRIMYLLLAVIPLTLIAYFVAPAKSWNETSWFLIIILIINFLVIFTLFSNIFLNYLLRSFIFGIGLLLITIFQAANKLNIYVAIFIIFITVVAATLFPKFRYHINTVSFLKRLTINLKVSKLSRIRRR